MIIMGVDFGDARTGLAVCDKGEMLASPVGVISEKDFMLHRYMNRRKNGLCVLNEKKEK